MLTGFARPTTADDASPSLAEHAQARLELLALSAATSTALREGVLRALLRGPDRTPGELATELELDERVLERVLGLLAEAGVVARSPGEETRFGPGPPLAALREHAAVFARIELAVWERLPEALRTGRPAFPEGKFSNRGWIYAQIADDLASISRSAAERLAARLEVPPGPILDVGCGAGVWSLALARANPGVRVVGLDLPAVTPRFLSRAREMGLADRVETLPGDMSTVKLEPGAHGLVIAAHVLRLETPDRARSLLARLAEAVSPDGALLVIDALPGSAARDRQLHAAYRLHLALRNAGGDTLDPSVLEQWLEDEGLGRIERVDLDARGLPGALVARRA